MKKGLKLVLISLLSLLPLFTLPNWSQSATLPPAEYFTLIQQKIAANLRYPLEAEAKDWEGVVEVKFTLTPDGQIKTIDIAESSGYPLLDTAAIQAIKDASPYPFLHYSLAAEELEITLPVNFEYVSKPPEAVEDEQPKLKPELKTQAELELMPGLAKEPQTEIKIEPSEEINGFIDLAIKSNQPTQIALQETALAQLKIGESFRNLLPALKLQAYNTAGEVHDLEYDEREVKLQLAQPIYYGGRLKNSLSRAKINLEITRRNYDRLKIDVAHKTEVSYYNLVAGRMNLNTQQAILEEAERLLNIIQQLHSAELVTPLEAASALSWYEQICFQYDSTKQDTEMAELTFRQVLNTAELPQITKTELAIEHLNLNLANCVQAGLKLRPEIQLSNLLVKFSQYANEIEKGRNKFSVDLNTSYGHYLGAYTTEDMTASSNWYIGIKATKPFGANTSNLTASSEAVEPRFGQTSPTKATTVSGEFNILDNLKRLSDKKESEINLAKAISDLNETKKTIRFEIKDAYLNYEKTLLAAKAALSETEFRSRELNVLRVRAEVGEVGFANVLEALVNLSQAQTKYIQALANYYISLANLKQATGYGIEI